VGRSPSPLDPDQLLMHTVIPVNGLRLALVDQDSDDTLPLLAAAFDTTPDELLLYRNCLNPTQPGTATWGNELINADAGCGTSYTPADALT
jgi:hypothetical protein